MGVSPAESDLHSKVWHNENELTTPPIGQEAEVANARESFRQDVLEKAAQELLVSQASLRRLL